MVVVVVVVVSGGSSRGYSGSGSIGGGGNMCIKICNQLVETMTYIGRTRNFVITKVCVIIYKDIC